MSKKSTATESRPWGSFWILDEGIGFKVKRIEVKSKARLSLQSHRHRRENWTVVQGKALVTLDAKQYLLAPGESIMIPPGAQHRVANPGEDNLVIIEVQNGSYLGEDDIIRYEDDFQRA